MGGGGGGGGGASRVSRVGGPPPPPPAVAAGGGLGKALGVDLPRIDALAKSHQWFDRREESLARLAEHGLDPAAPVMPIPLDLPGAAAERASGPDQTLPGLAGGAGTDARFGGGRCRSRFGGSAGDTRHTRGHAGPRG